MLKRSLFLIFLASSVSGFTQSLASLNYRYLYDPENEIDLPIKLVNEKGQLTVYFKLQLKDAQDAARNYSISWDRRESYIQKDGISLAGIDSVGAAGKYSFPAPEKPWILVAKIFNANLNKRWTYYQVIDAKYPVDGFVEDENGIAFSSYVKAGKAYTFRGAQANRPLKIFYYKTDFPAALPPFADKDLKTDRFMFADSTFEVANGAKLLLNKPGLYLSQQDTIAAQGFCIRVVTTTFPRFTKVEDIPPPLVFVSTKEEFDDLLDADGDKAKVDKVILDITGAKDRAKDFMKSYFRRVELTNLFFTTYKEGWKSDRGMIFLIFGLPDEISRTGANEIWIYKNLKERFTFLKSGSVYDPQHYVLMRNARLAATWYSTIDLWRKSQF